MELVRESIKELLIRNGGYLFRFRFASEARKKAALVDIGKFMHDWAVLPNLASRSKYAVCGFSRKKLRLARKDKEHRLFGMKSRALMEAWHTERDEKHREECADHAPLGFAGKPLWDSFPDREQDEEEPLFNEVIPPEEDDPELSALPIRTKLPLVRHLQDHLQYS